MTLICKICEEKASFMLTVNCGRFNTHTYYCKKHKPKEIILDAFMNEDQNSNTVKRIFTKNLDNRLATK